MISYLQNIGSMSLGVDRGWKINAVIVFFIQQESLGQMAWRRNEGSIHDDCSADKLLDQIADESPSFDPSAVIIQHHRQPVKIKQQIYDVIRFHQLSMPRTLDKAGFQRERTQQG